MPSASSFIQRTAAKHHALCLHPVTDQRLPSLQVDRANAQRADNQFAIVAATMKQRRADSDGQSKSPSRSSPRLHSLQAQSAVFPRAALSRRLLDCFLPVRDQTLDLHIRDHDALGTNRVSHFGIEEKHIAAPQQDSPRRYIKNDTAIHTGGNRKCQDGPGNSL